MSSQQFPRLGTPSTGLSQAPSQISNSGSAGLINPAATGELCDGFFILPPALRILPVFNLKTSRLLLEF